MAVSEHLGSRLKRELSWFHLSRPFRPTIQADFKDKHSVIVLEVKGAWKIDS